VLKTAGIIFVAAIFFVGCESQKPPPSDWSAIPQPSIVVQTNKTISAPTKSDWPAVSKSAAPITTWTSLARWASDHNVGKPRRISNSPVATYSIASTNGTMVLGIGTRGATWNGIEINLGFEPQFIDGEIFLHGLDLQKNLEPLLCGPPLSCGTNRIIVIDPGHGGNNPGTVSALDGRLEKEFTLDLAKRLATLLETNRWKVFLTRTSDMTVSNQDRVVFADMHRADFFISLHFNATANRDEKSSGIETYCLTPMGMPSTLTRGFADPWFVNLPDNEFDVQNLQLAVRLHTALVRATGLNDRGVCHARFMTVLQGQHRPAVLIEAGYLSNPRDAKLIESEEHRQKLAETIADALR
jgi:N-acetylmuramoyl-L-alanine amidase